MAAALWGWGHEVVDAESASEARARLEAGGIDVALIDDALIAAEPAAWRTTLDGRHAAVIVMTEAGVSEGVAPPYELSALRSALRGVSKELV